MLVRDLIELLEGYDADMEVHFAYNYGDHWRTEVAPRVDDVREGAVVYSDYHRMDKIVENDDDDFDEETGEERVDETLRRVVVLG
jgi:hypothetical protein